MPDRLTQTLPSLLPSLDLAAEPTIEPLMGDASNRTWYRLRSGDRTFIAMVLAEGFNSLAEQITKTNRKITKLPVIDLQRYFENRGVRVPKILAHNAGRGVLILEDFGDRLLQDVVFEGKPNAIRTLYENALDQLERIAVVPPNEPKTSIAFARNFDRDLYNWEFLHFVEFALDKRIPSGPKPADREAIVRELSKLTEEYLTWDPVIVHRDYHSRNLMVLNERELGVVDFQDALLGPLYYDLASLLRDSYARLDARMQDECVERYRLQLKSQKIKGTVSRDKFRRAFDLMGLHRNLKAAGRFCYLDQEKKNPNYLPHVPRTLGYVRDTLGRHLELRTLKKTLLPYLDVVSRSCE